MVSNGLRSLVRFGHQTEIERHFEWLVASRTLHVIPGTVNPSNERYLTNWYTYDAFRTAEFEAILNTLKKVLLN